jgi:SET domain-containing protein
MAFLVRTRLAPSPIQGLGVFAAETIAKGTVVWRFDPAIDRTYTEEEVAALIGQARDFLARYAYLDDRLGLYVLCGDDARFVNHSSEPNVTGDYPANGPREGVDLAARDIEPGEEIFCDYGSFDREAAAKLR